MKGLSNLQSRTGCKECPDREMWSVGAIDAVCGLNIVIQKCLCKVLWDAIEEGVRT